MLTYDFNHRGGLALYDYLYRCIKQDILSGALKPDEKLPSKRGLAQHLRLSVVTVENAYAQLIAEGYVCAVEKKGYFVADVGSAPEQRAPLESMQPEPERKKYKIDLKTNSINAKYFPFSIWSRIMRDVLSNQDKELLKSMPYNGIYELRSAIADHLYRFRGITVSPGQIIIGAGTELLYNLIIQLLGQDSVFAVENPGYSKMAQIYRANGVEYRFVDLDDQGVTVAGLRSSGANVLHISPSHHFPTGIVTPIGRRQELIVWADESPDRYIIEDDYDSEFRFTGRPIPTMQSTDTGEKVIYINSFSKSIAPSIRISYMILPPHLCELFRRRLAFYSCTVSSFEQYTLARFITGGFFENHINRIKKLYRTERDSVIGAIRQSRLSRCASICEMDSGLHFLLRIDADIDDAAVAAACESRRIRLSFMSEYISGRMPQYDHYIVVNYSGIDAQRLPEALDELADIVENDVRRRKSV
jgi:GntR family transcriptional regulator/MocR family aminotransferase